MIIIVIIKGTYFVECYGYKLKSPIECLKFEFYYGRVH